MGANRAPDYSALPAAKTESEVLQISPTGQHRGLHDVTVVVFLDVGAVLGIIAAAIQKIPGNR